ncbi:HET-domain-containing protein [Aspergillus sclerotiicarbonarius CBS 121057]|uniref:HET-domain-containing protein n=1 Tax=Aspergillus sclerotiicarbonarius (strain CBS 121057 / IBT 28362) TaxID=1448318 RepID=A0A319EW74_ASPSB|nr:HET-domain-containing protein [Aspergillus sclerotiicarbonarius CBS 121057]
MAQSILLVVKHLGNIGFFDQDAAQYLPQQVNWERINSWLQVCMKCSPKEFRDRPPGFRVIEVATQRVIPGPPSCKYAALSYVWGRATAPEIEATTSNIHDLQMVGLSDLPVPATIRDAIVASSKMGMQYLWVDRLCILQDSSDDKCTQVNAMDKIYSNAAVTIVALAGSDAHYGLPGVSERKRALPWVYDGQGICMAELLRPYEEISAQSVWHTRGWTFQEGMLSTNLLMFSDWGVFYEAEGCTGVRDEEEEWRRSDSDPIFHPASRSRGKDTTGSYEGLVQNYTKRDLSWPSDILRAITGS